VLPFVTEEVWSWWQDGSVHRATWPEADELRRLAADGDPAVLDLAATVITAVRKAKSEARLSMRADAAGVRIEADDATLARVRRVLADLQSAGRVQRVDLVTGAGLTVDVSL
jgi:valyl-tRNA synthetase